MPRFQSSDIAHTASTDHRILRPGKAAPQPYVPTDRLEPFLPKGVPATDPELSRDHALALLQSAGASVERRDRGLAMLERACADFPDDTEALEQWGTALIQKDRAKDAARVFAEVLELAPRRERALAGYAFALEATGKTDAAIGYWQRAVSANPWLPLYRAHLATLLAKKRDWEALKPQAAAWLRLDPGSLDARKTWITALVKTGALPSARAELDRARALNPLSQGRLQAWYDDLVRIN